MLITIRTSNFMHHSGIQIITVRTCYILVHLPDFDVCLLWMARAFCDWRFTHMGISHPATSMWRNTCRSSRKTSLFLSNLNQNCNLNTFYQNFSIPDFVKIHSAVLQLPHSEKHSTKTDRWQIMVKLTTTFLQLLHANMPKKFHNLTVKQMPTTDTSLVPTKSQKVYKIH